jgi:hypothetical protein
VYYQAKENKINIFKLISTEGFKRLPEMLARTLLIFSIIMLLIYFIATIIKIGRKGFFQRFLKFWKSFAFILGFLILLTIINFLSVNNISENNKINAWEYYAAKLLSSGPLPESNITNIINEKKEEIQNYIQPNKDNDVYLNCYIKIGIFAWSFSYNKEYGFTSHFINQIYDVYWGN